MGTVAFNTDVDKTVDINKLVNLDVNKNVNVDVNISGNLATAEASADAIGENTLAETDTFAQATETGSFSFSESLAAVSGGGTTQPQPGIDIEKATNGEDADAATGPEILAGETAIFTYVVTNTGDVPLGDVEVTDDQGVTVTFDSGDDNGDSLLDLDEIWIYSGSTTVTTGQYTNTATVTGTDPDGTVVTDSDPSNHLGIEPGFEPGIDIEKSTNGEDADFPTGPDINVGETATFTYVVTNTGDVALGDVEVTDDQGVTVTFESGDDNGDSLLDLDETWIYSGSTTVTLGQYTNTATVTGTDPDGTVVTDDDPSHHFGTGGGTGEVINLPDGLEITDQGGSNAAVSPATVTTEIGDEGNPSFTVTVEVGEVPAIADVVLMQDLSGSFSDDLPNVQAQFSDLYDTLNEAGLDTDFGVSSFVDKPIVPFGLPPSGSFAGDFAYNTDLPVSGDKDAVQAALDALNTLNGEDFPESQLEGLLQVAVRADTEVGYREIAQRFVVLSTDADFHVEGDYNFKNTEFDPAGFGQSDPPAVGEEIPDNNGDEILDGDPPGTGEDYPNIDQVGNALNDEDITVIFAVTSLEISTYEDLLDDLGVDGTVVELSSDSSNIADAILEALEETTVDLEPQVLSDDFGFIQSVSPTEISDVAGPSTETFEITLQVPDSYGSDDVTITIPGFGSTVISFDIETRVAAGGPGNDSINGSNGPDDLSGLGGDDVITGNGGNDTMTGGSGGDTFVIGDNDGSDEITDFDVSETDEVIDLSTNSFLNSFADVTANAADDGTDMVINTGDSSSLTLLDVTVADLAADDFDF